MSKDKGPATIGRVTIIDFPKLGIHGIPAKVDTGADASSMWASNIVEKNRQLHFSLFAPGSPYYNGEIISTKEYKIRSIKNSFGTSEFRYKVKLKVIIEGRSITVGFTLANRATNHFPVLIGRRTLQGKFVVDVSRSHSRSVFKVLVLDIKSIKSVQEFFKQIQNSNTRLRFTVSTFNDLEFLIDTTHTKIRLASSGEDIANFDFVFFKSVVPERDTAAALAGYLENSGTAFMDRANIHYPLNNKLAQYITLQRGGVQVPKSLFMASNELIDRYAQIINFLGKPFILKDIKGSKGRNNFLVSNKKEFERIMRGASKSSMQLIAQQFITNEGDYRVLVFGRKVRLVIHRKAVSDKTHLNNTSVGGIATLVDENILPGFVRQMSIEAVKLLKLDIAGVDMVRDTQTGIWYCLEVNHGPQIASGSFVNEKKSAFTDYILEEREKNL